MRVLRVCVAGVVCWFAATATAPALAQTSAGTISGTVLDATGAVMPGAEITVKNVDTGVARVLTTNERGRYLAPQLISGNYEVSASAAGFQTEVRRGITLAIGREAVVDFSLSVGAVAETVEVTGEAPLVETTTATTSGLVDEATVKELPLNGRNFTDLMDLNANVKRLASVRGTSPTMGFGAQFSVAGAHPSQNKYVIDGVNTGDGRQSTPGSAAGNVLGTEAVREFRVITSNYSAEHGEVTGGIMSAATKSGTNTLHGSVFEYLRNSAMDARDYFDRDPDNPTERSDPAPFRKNQFGFSLGGPIVRDHSFYFGNYEGLRERLASTDTPTVPLPNARRGILEGSAVCTAATPCAIHPRVQQILNLYPEPNFIPPVRNPGMAQYVTTTSTATREDYFAVRMDHTLNDRNFMFGRYTFSQGRVTDPHALGLFTAIDYNRYQSVTLSFTSMLSPVLLNTFRAGMNRNVTSQTVPIDLRREGVTEEQVIAALQFFPGRPPGSFSVTQGPSGLGGGGGTSDFWWNALRYYDDANYTKGNHNLKFGGSLQRNQDNQNRDFWFEGIWSFANMTNFYAGNPRQLQSVPASVDARRGFRTWWVGSYIQDDWKALPSLTLNLGVRLEWITVPTEVNGKIGILENLYTSTDAVAAASVGKPFWEQESFLDHLAPRVGFAWDPFGNGKTAIRGGFGVFQEAVRNYDFSLPGNRMPPFYATQQTTNTPSTPLVFPNVLDNQGVAIKRLDTIDARLQQPYKLSWSLDIQREILPRTVLNIGYQGSRGVHLLAAMSDANTAPTAVAPDGHRYVPGISTTAQPFAARPNVKFDQIRWRHSGNDSYFQSMKFTVTKQASRGFQLSSAYTWAKSIDTNSIRLSQGTEFGNSDQEAFPHNTRANRGPSSWDIRHYWSTNFVYELPFGPGKALGSNLNGLGAKLLAGWSMSGILTLTSGPPFSVLLGQDYTQKQPQGGGGGAAKPDLLLGVDPYRENYREDPEFGGYLNPFAFALPPLTPDCAPLTSGGPLRCARLMFGNIGRNTLTGPGLFSLDFNLTKNTNLTENIQLQFRAEAFNILNRPNFGLPNGTIFNVSLPTGNAAAQLASAQTLINATHAGLAAPRAPAANPTLRNPSTGNITSTTGTGRQMQLALRLIF